MHNKRRTHGQRVLAGFVFLWMFAAAAPCAMAGPCEPPVATPVSHCHHGGHATHQGGDCGKPTKPDCRNIEQTVSLDTKPVSTAGHYVPVVLHTLPVALHLPDEHRLIRNARLRIHIPETPLNLLHANLLI